MKFEREERQIVRKDRITASGVNIGEVWFNKTVGQFQCSLSMNHEYPDVHIAGFGKTKELAVADAIKNGKEKIVKAQNTINEIERLIQEDGK